MASLYYKKNVSDVDVKKEENLSQLEQLLNKQKENEKRKPEICACWCTGWAEVSVVKPYGLVNVVFFVLSMRITLALPQAARLSIFL